MPENNEDEYLEEDDEEGTDEEIESAADENEEESEESEVEETEAYRTAIQLKTTDVNKQPVYDLMSKIFVMKPSSVADDNLKGQIKLNSLLLSKEYSAEEKIDGCHYMMSSGLFFSKEHIEKTDNFPHLRDFFIRLMMPNLLLDGEINYPGRTSQYCTRVTGASADVAVAFQEANGYIHYTLYDMLRTPKGTWLLKEPFSKRRKILEYFYNTYVANTPLAEFIHLTEIVYDNKDKYKDAILASGKEGIVLKKLNSLYLMGKKPAWIWTKIKQADETDLVIMGFEPASKEYKGKNYDAWPFWAEENGQKIPVSKNYYNNWIGSVTLGAYVQGHLTKVCTASGIDDAMRADMSTDPHKYLNRVVQVTFMELTEDRIPRHPSIKAMHPDKEPGECLWNFEND